jgi:hypothetical protein
LKLEVSGALLPGTWDKLKLIPIFCLFAVVGLELGVAAMKILAIVLTFAGVCFHHVSSADWYVVPSFAISTIMR